MPTLPIVKAANEAFKPSYVPVAVFVGGTSGIGEAMVKAVASYMGGNVHLVIIGRNRAAAEKTFASLPAPPLGEDGDPVLREFMSCDASLMKNISATCTELGQKVSKINFLVLSAGFVQFSGREETEEGLDKMLALRYYHRFKVIQSLLPRLQKASDAGEQASVLSILGARSSPLLEMDNLDMKNRYGAFKAAAWSGAYNNIMIEGFSKRNPDIGFTHIFPGFVNTPGLSIIYKRWPARLLAPLIILLAYLLAITPEESAEYMLYALLDGKKGWFLRDEKGNDEGTARYTYSDEEKEAVWQHSLQMTATA
ncbi:NAD(P)-binding protein [Hymenopellis radicata]|nr:NAD(P)-binding protein [Hymenopellis radicata]